MNAETTRPNRPGRVIGAVIFGLGMIMLVVVFALAATAFARIPSVLGSGSAASGPALGEQLAAIGAQALFLLVMAYVSSLVASKGLELYQAARTPGGE